MKRLTSGYVLRKPHQIVASITEELGTDADPLRALIEIGFDKEVPIGIRVDALKNAAAYVHPKRTSIDVNDENVRPEVDIHLLHSLLQGNAALVEAAQQIALATSVPLIEATAEELEDN